MCIRDRMEPEELALLLRRIARESGYRRLVVDMGHMGRGSAALLDCCDGVYLPVLEDPVSRAKLQAFDRYLSAAGAVSLKEKICRLRLPKTRPCLLYTSPPPARCTGLHSEPRLSGIHHRIP